MQIHELLASVCLKAISLVGPEAVALSETIKGQWVPKAREFLEATLDGPIDLAAGTFDKVLVKQVIKDFKKPLGTEFILDAEDFVSKYTELAYFEGISLSTKVQKDLFDELSGLTGAQRKNTVRTIKRWFKTTQGRYFERFIIPYMGKLDIKITDAAGRKATLNKIGRDYKAFVEADGYWSSISDFDVSTSFSWARIDTLHELKVTTYQIMAVIDKKTCGVCEDLDGTIWRVADAREQIASMFMMGAEEAAEQFPWPRKSDLEGVEPNTTDFRLPPFHARCRCHAVQY